MLVYDGPKEVISKKDAEAAGLRKYFTGKPCLRGHVGERYVGGGRCVACVSENGRNDPGAKEYRRKYYQEHKDHHAELQHGWYLKHKKEHHERSDRWYKDHPDAYREKNARKVERRRNLRVLEAGRPRPDGCEICGRREILVFDHDHAHGNFRGWLCNRCNRALGLAGDNVEVLLQMALYLERTRSELGAEVVGG